jgi:hypothetical protein
MKTAGFNIAAMPPTPPMPSAPATVDNDANDDLIAAV